jgi:HK97 family phage portal protein
MFMMTLKTNWFKKEKEPVQNLPKEEDKRSLSEVMDSIDSRIETMMRKQLDHAGMVENLLDDTGGYFGNEFELAPNVGRMKSLFSREPWIAAASSLVARTLSSVPFVVYDKLTQKQIPNHPIEILMKSGSTIEDGLATQWAGDLDIDLTGNAFFVFDENYKSYVHVPCQYVYPIMADPIKDGRVGIQKIQVSLGAKETFLKKEYLYKHVLHIKLPNPDHKFFGMPVWLAATRAILLDRYKSEYEMAFYLRGATHTGVIETSEDLGKKMLARLQRTMESAFTGRRNWWRPLILPKGAKWISSSPTMTEMQHLEAMRENRKTILGVRGVPPSMVGLIEDVNRATSEQQLKSFWENTIVPMALFKASGWNNSYLVRDIYRAKVEVRADFSRIEALQGSLISRGEQAKSVENHWTLDEIRTKIYQLPPIGDDRGSKLVKEIVPPVMPSLQLAEPLSLMDQVAQGTPASQLEQEPAQTQLKKVSPRVKQDATDSQNRIEEKLASSFKSVYQKYIDETIELAIQTIMRKGSVQQALNSTRDKRLADYWSKAKEPMTKAMDRGFVAAQANVRSYDWASKKDVSYSFSVEDTQAINAIKERTSDGQRKLLSERGLSRFWGHDEKVTDQIIDIIDEGYRAGKPLDKIAREIRDTYGDKYPNQANTIVRTEILSAISQGMVWNQEALQEVFTKVQKQWLHQGDVGSNPDAREWHAGWDNQGIVDVGHVYKGTDDQGKSHEMRYPRDPQGEASDIINCRCSLVSIIPDDAISNSNAILDTNF